MRRLRLVSTWLVVLALVACGQSAGPDGTPTSSGDQSPRASSAAVTAAAVTGAHTVALDPVMYAAGTDCASVTTTVAAALTPPACALDWFRYSSDDVPGQQDVSRSALTSMTVGPGVDVAAATSVATAYLRAAAINAWAADHASTAVIQAVGITGTDYDPALAVVQDGGSFAVYPSCMLPSAIAAVRPSATLASYLSIQGDAPPGPLVLVVTYPPCIGITYVRGQGPLTEYGHALAQSYVVEATEQDLGEPLGQVAMPTLEIGCGVTAARSVCGV